MVTLVTMDPGHTVAELFTPDGIKQWTQVAAKIRASGQVLSVVSPLTALQWNDNLVSSPSGDITQSVAGKVLAGDLTRTKSKAAQTVRTASALATVARINAIPKARRTFANPEYIDFLLYDNPQPKNPKPIRTPAAAILPRCAARADGRASPRQRVDQEGRRNRRPRRPRPRSRSTSTHAEITTTGAPALLENLNNYLTGGMATLALIAIGIMTLILLLLFSVRWRLLPLGIVLIGTIWAFGIAGYLGIPLTIVTISGLPVMLGIGIDYAIQMHARVEEEAVIDRAEHPIQETARNLGPALLVVTFDAIFAFAALRWAKVPMLREFGALLIIGVIAICTCSIIGTLAILGIREFKSPTKGRDFHEGPLGKLTVRLGSVPDRIAPLLVIASVLVFVGGIAVENKLVLQTDPTQWVNQHSQVIKNLNVLDREVHSSSELGVFVQARNVFAQPTVAFVDDFTRNQLEKHPDTLLTASGLVSTVSELSDVQGAPHLTPTSADVKAAYDGRAPRHQAVDGRGAGHRDEHHLPYRPEWARCACEGRARNPRDGASATDHSRHAVRPRGRGSRPARQPRSQPRHPHVYLDPLGVLVPHAAAPERHPCAAFARSGVDRGRCLVVVRLHAQPQAEPDDGRRRSTGCRGVHGVHVVDPLAIRGGTAARLGAPRRDGCRGRRGPVGHSSCRRSPRSPALP